MTKLSYEEKKAQIKLLQEVLLDFEKSQLERKGFDFYFVLRNKLDTLIDNH